jgi:hypothetical protein
MNTKKSVEKQTWMIAAIAVAAVLPNLVQAAVTATALVA